MSADDALIAEIVELAKNHTGAKTVTAATRLYSDLGMTGDDAHEFLLAFAIKYDVDMGGLDWLRYFDNEASSADMLAPAMVLAASVLNPAFAVRWQSARDAEREITIAHLADVARAKLWRVPDQKRMRTQSALMLIFSVCALALMLFFLLTAGFVTYGLLTGQIGDTSALTLAGVAAVGVLFPVYLGVLSWRAIQQKLASTPNA